MVLPPAVKRILTLPLPDDGVIAPPRHQLTKPASIPPTQVAADYRLTDHGAPSTITSPAELGRDLGAVRERSVTSVPPIDISMRLRYFREMCPRCFMPYTDCTCDAQLEHLRRLAEHTEPYDGTSDAVFAHYLMHGSTRYLSIAYVNQTYEAYERDGCAGLLDICDTDEACSICDCMRRIRPTQVSIRGWYVYLNMHGVESNTCTEATNIIKMFTTSRPH